MITNPVQCGTKTLPFYPGHFYVAFCGAPGEEVNINFVLKFDHIRQDLLTQDTFVYHQDWPALLCYHIHQWSIKEGISRFLGTFGPDKKVRNQTGAELCQAQCLLSWLCQMNKLCF